MNFWIYVAVIVHVIIAIIFITGLLYYYYQANTLAVKIATALDKNLKSYGFDAAPFIPEWYNTMSSVVKMSYHDQAVCVVVISNADLFDKTLPAYIKEHHSGNSDKDLIDQCASFYINKAVNEIFPDENVDVIFDYDLQINSRLPKINMQTAGHAAGLAYFNRAESIQHPPESWEQKTKMFGCSISPRYGGWFAYRAVVVFKDILDDRIQYLPPHDSVGKEEDKIELLTYFNNDWKDVRWRDIIVSEKRYSEEQIEYFNTLPSKRSNLTKAIIERALYSEHKKHQ